MQLNQKGIDLIKSFEGCRLQSYQDQGGIWTIGYGATGDDIGPNMEWTQEQADARLVQDLHSTENHVSSCLKVSLSDNKFSALVSFAYNVGCGNFEHSTLLRYVNVQDFEAAHAEFAKWDRVGGVERPGLERRRLAEAALFADPS